MLMKYGIKIKIEKKFGIYNGCRWRPISNLVRDGVFNNKLKRVHWIIL